MPYGTRNVLDKSRNGALRIFVVNYVPHLYHIKHKPPAVHITVPLGSQDTNSLYQNMCCCTILVSNENVKNQSKLPEIWLLNIYVACLIYQQYDS